MIHVFTYTYLVFCDKLWPYAQVWYYKNTKNVHGTKQVRSVINKDILLYVIFYYYI